MEERNDQQSEQQETSQEHNPWASPQAETAQQDMKPIDPRPDKGIRRSVYFRDNIGAFLAVQLVCIVIIIILRVLPWNFSGIQLWLQITTLIGFAIISFLLKCLRLRNMGFNPRYALLMLVPVANIVLEMGCLVCQEDFAKTRKLDRNGFFALVLLLLAMTSILLIYLFG